MRPRKIIVIGCSGSGKSHFSNELSKRTNLPIYHLDMLYWKPNWVSTPREEFKKIINDVMDKDEWIIDGNYNGTLEDRFRRAELVYFLDLPTEVCLDSEKERRGKRRSDLPDYLEEKEDPEFVEYIKRFKDEGRLRILSLIELYSKVSVITFKSRDEINSYLNEL